MIGNGDGFLAGQAVGDQQHFFGGSGGFNCRHFRHQHFIGIGTARRVEHNDIKTAQLAGLKGALGDIDRILPVNNRQGFDIDLFAKHGQLLHGCGTLRIQGRHQHFALMLLADEFRQFGRRSRFTRALQTHHHEDDRRHGIERERRCRAQHINQRIIDDFDNLLAGRDRFQNLRANGERAHPVQESARHGQGHIGLQ